MAKQRGIPGGREAEANARMKGIQIPMPDAARALARPGGDDDGDGPGGNPPNAPCSEGAPGFPDCLASEFAGVVKRVLKDVAVEAISLVPAAANRRAFIAKSAGECGQAFIEREVEIVKTDKARRMVYGVVYAPGEADTDGDAMTADEVEKAAYRFMASGRTGEIDADHDGETGKGFVAESWIVRKGDPVLPDETEGAWAVGIKVTDETVWDRVEKGELRGLSMLGKAKAFEVSKSARPNDGSAAEDVTTPSGFLSALRRVFLGAAEASPASAEAAASEPSPVVKESDQVSAPEAASQAAEGALPNDGSATETAEQAVAKGISEKLNAVRGVLADFEAYVVEQLGAAVEKGAGVEGAAAGAGASDGEALVAGATADNDTQAQGATSAERAGGFDMAAVVKALEALTERVDAVAQAQDARAQELAERLEAVEKQTPGRGTRESMIGKSAKEKGFKGITIPL